jgi:hypothetical protein
MRAMLPILPVMYSAVVVLSIAFVTKILTHAHAFASHRPVVVMLKMPFSKFREYTNTKCCAPYKFLFPAATPDVYSKPSIGLQVLSGPRIF